MNLIKIFLFAAIIGLFAAPAYPADKIAIGAVEEIIIMPFGVKVPARVDTGAAASSLDVSDYKIEGEYVSFNLAERCGGHKIRSRMIEVKSVRTTDGITKRPVIAVDVCIGSELIKTNVTLKNRSKMRYPFLMGRTALQGKYVVDVSRRNILPPACPDSSTLSPSNHQASTLHF
jgi:hypothetical protein